MVASVDNTRKQNILIVHNYYQIPGGEDTVVANEKQMLEDHGHKVVLYSRNNSELKEMSTLQKLMLPFTTVFNPRTYRDIKHLIKTEKIDIVHVHNTLNLISPAVYYAARVMGVPVVQTIHNFRLLCPGATFYRDGHICEDCVSKGLMCSVKHRCYRNSRLQTLACVISTKIHRMTGIYGKISYICLTEFNKDKLIQLKQIKPDRVYVKPNFTYEPEIKNDARKYYLFIGRVEEIKGLPVVIEAFEKMPNKHLMIAGTGTKLEDYKRQTYRANNIEFKGFVQKNELQKLLKKAKAVIVASQWYETFGMIAVEAFSSRVPVIAGDIGNVASLVDDGVNGVKFQYDSSNSLIQAVKRFEQLPREKLGENAYMKYKKNYAQDGNYEMLNKIYSSISAGGYSLTLYSPKQHKENMLYTVFYTGKQVAA